MLQFHACIPLEITWKTAFSFPNIYVNSIEDECFCDALMAFQEFFLYIAIYWLNKKNNWLFLKPSTSNHSVDSGSIFSYKTTRPIKNVTVRTYYKLSREKNGHRYVFGASILILKVFWFTILTILENLHTNSIFLAVWK